MEILGGSALNKKGMIWKVNSSSSSIGCGFGAVIFDSEFLECECFNPFLHFL
ncbi:hypothetical protein AXX17_AT5G06840 [Arabidopsis thaliana]|uniref:Uncharacterized protein n=1 Tax=Arabidopsis thaliana TaxID=3702 RepID=A0A178UCQ9_ARATH|nr:hypothetical protein AXX17_AT5G06840 [Arabidopsis thaliana]